MSTVQIPIMSGGQCFVCDKDLILAGDRSVELLANFTEHTNTGLPTKIGQLMGDGFMVVVTASDEVCSRCVDLLNFMDKLELDLEKVKRLLTSYLRNKYGLIDAIKEEPPDTYENDHRVSGLSFHRLELDVNAALCGSKEKLQRDREEATYFKQDRKADVAEENSRLCALLRAALDSKQNREASTLSDVAGTLKRSKSRLTGSSTKVVTLHEDSQHESITIESGPLNDSLVEGSFDNSQTQGFNEDALKPHRCDVCNEKFTSQAELDDHVNSHNVYQCADCGAAYEELEKLMIHSCVSQEVPETVNNTAQDDPFASDISQPTNSTERDFDALCRATLQGEAEFTSQASVSVEESSVKGNCQAPADIISHSGAISMGTQSNIVKNSGGKDIVNLGDVNELFESDDEFVPEEYDDEINEDDDDESLDDVQEDKKLTKIYVDGVEVSFSDIVGEEEGIFVEDLVSAELAEDSEETLKEDKSLAERQTVKRKVLVCSVCNFRTPNHNAMKKHLESHNMSLALDCEICKMKLKTQRTYDKHMKRHLESDKSAAPVSCNVCKEIVPDKFSMRKHMIDNHPDLFKCQFCDEVCDSIRARRRHEATHSSASDKTCEKCGKTFRRQTQFEVHRDYAHRDPKCRYCNKVFDKPTKLKDHEKRHNRDKEGFPCRQCDKVLKTASGLKLHKAKHTGQYKFCCDVCGRGFMSKAIMEEHMGRHTQEKRYTCDVCGKMFVFNSTMRIHRKWHDNPLPYKCTICGQKFRHTSLLSVHRRRMHTGERPYKCPYCALTFTVSNCLKRHVVLHTGAYPYFCEPCGKGFTTKQKLAVHLAKVHNNREMLNAKAPPCEYKMVIPNQPGQGPAEADSDEEHSLATPVEPMEAMEEVEHVEEVEHIIIQSDEQQLEAEGNIQLQIITMDAENGFPEFD